MLNSSGDLKDHSLGSFHSHTYEDESSLLKGIGKSKSEARDAHSQRKNEAEAGAKTQHSIHSNPRRDGSSKEEFIPFMVAKISNERDALESKPQGSVENRSSSDSACKPRDSLENYLERNPFDNRLSDQKSINYSLKLGEPSICIIPPSKQEADSLILSEILRDSIKMK